MRLRLVDLARSFSARDLVEVLGTVEAIVFMVHAIRKASEAKSFRLFSEALCREGVALDGVEVS
jgi:hypothetical protein